MEPMKCFLLKETLHKSSILRSNNFSTIIFIDTGMRGGADLFATHVTWNV